MGGEHGNGGKRRHFGRFWIEKEGQGYSTEMCMSIPHFQIIENASFPRRRSTAISLLFSSRKVLGFKLLNLPTDSDGSKKRPPILSGPTRKLRCEISR